MGLYKNNNGVLSPIAGRGKAEYGASTVRTGTFSLSGTSWARQNITFAEPMPDTDYIVSLETSTAAYLTATPYTIDNKTVNGFQLSIFVSGSTAISYDGTYTAFKLYTDNEYNGLLNNQRYSTDEIDTGKTWIDGKKIYRKVIAYNNSITYSTSQITRAIGSLPSNYESLVELRGIESNSVTIPRWANLPGITVNVELYMDGNVVTLRLYRSVGEATLSGIKVIAEYTKTT